MKFAIIGGGGARVPLLVHGLCRSDLPLAQIALYDPNAPRQAAIARVAQARAGDVAVRVCATSAEAIAGAQYVFVSIRVGGIEARARDEAAAVRHGVIGQETVGPGGFAMALRTVPAVLEYAREIERLAPAAWVINFTNPVGIVTQAVRTQTRARVIGICDTPTELFEDVAHALGTTAAQCQFDYLGLNHLGWLREVYRDGEPQLARLFATPDKLRGIYRAPLFEPDFLVDLGLLPTEYLYYYYRSADALAHVLRAGQTRGEALLALNRQLFATLADPAQDPVRVYEAYIAARDAGYMQLESGASAPLARSPWAALTGYDKMALAVVRALHFDRGDVLPLNVSNDDKLAGLAAEDIVEVPCTVGAQGAAPHAVGAAPERVSELLARVKAYERATLATALSPSREGALDALALNPLIDSRDRAAAILREIAASS